MVKRLWSRAFATIALLACGGEGDILRGKRTALPIEVLGAGAAEAQALVALEPDVAARATTLFLRVHGLRAGAAAEVRVNDAPAVSLTDASAVAGPARAFGGIGGAFSTLDLALPLPPGALRSGRNVLTFSQTTPAPSPGARPWIGYRVLDVDLLAASGVRLLPDGSFAKAAAPAMAADSASAASGARLWRERALSWPAPGGTRASITAHCGDCHAEDGHDLHYFGYSDQSIVAWCELMGLSTVEGQQIAAYVRTLPGPRPGRPWNPPYQPGPGTDARPFEEWPAGAGLQAVAARDVDAVGPLLAQGSIEAIFSTKGNINLRELPISLQLPDWNRWLPAVAPRDSLPDYPSSSLAKGYAQIRAQVARLQDEDPVTDAVQRPWAQWIYDLNHVYRPQGDTSRWTPQQVTESYSIGSWMLVKMWELVEAFRLAQRATRAVAPSGETRTWFGDFPFMPVTPRGYPVELLVGSDAAFAVAQSQWEYLSVILNPGNRKRNGWGPVAWNGVCRHINFVALTTGHFEPVRALACATKAIQQSDNGVGPEDPAHGWSLTMADPTMVVEPSQLRGWDAVDPQIRASMLDALVGSWLARAGSFAPSTYARGDDGFEAPSVDHVPDPASHTIADNLFEAIKDWRALGLRASLANAVSDWGAVMWPAGRWASLKAP